MRTNVRIVGMALPVPSPTGRSSPTAQPPSPSDDPAAPESFHQLRPQHGVSGPTGASTSHPYRWIDTEPDRSDS